MLSLLCMKKLVAFIWLMVYMCVSTGFAVSTHYCMNKQRSIEFGVVQKAVCEKCGMTKQENHGCCRDEIKVVKLQQDTQVAKVLLASFQVSLPIALLSHHFISPFYNFTQTGTPTAFQPPPLYQKDICISNSVFRI